LLHCIVLPPRNGRTLAGPVWWHAPKAPLIILGVNGIPRPLPSKIRRRLLLALASVAVSPALAANGGAATVRIGLTPVFLDDQVSFLATWRDWFERRLGRPVTFVQRGNYREITDLLRTGKIDFAWVCGYPYVRQKAEMRLVAVPLWRGQPLYQSYLIVPADDRETKTVLDLKGKVFAYSDPDSNSGYLYPQYLLATHDQRPAEFFSRTFFTWAHRKVVEAVGVGLADGGAVDGYVWETLAEGRPELTAATRIIARSPMLGHPPFVASRHVPSSEVARFQRVLLDMAAEPEGRDLLHRLSLDGFAPVPPGLYDGIARMAEELHGR
jgi:phosphonate transport system substrate-binding protein